MKSLIKPNHIIFLLSFIFILSTSNVEDDIINLSDYAYPKNNLISNKYYIPILATNDLHGGIFPTKYSDSNKQRYSYGGANFIYSYKKILKEQWKDQFIWLDGGDQFTGTMECMLSNGSIMKDFYNQAGLDAITLGNHDFDYGIDTFREYIKSLNFPLLVANLKENGQYIYDTWENVKPYKIFERSFTTSKNIKIPIKIGVIGLATTTTPSQSAADFTNMEFTDYIPEIRKWHDYLRNEEKVNAVILLTHFGPKCDKDGQSKYELNMRKNTTNQRQCNQDQEIMTLLDQLKNEYSDIKIDGVVGGHVHDIVHHWISDIPVVESSGSDYFNILYLAFSFNKNTNTTSITKGDFQIEGPVPVCEKLWPDTKNCEYKYENSSLMKNFKFHGEVVSIDPDMEKKLSFWENIINSKIDYTLAETEDEMKMDNTKETLLTNFINDVGRIVTNSDICFYNLGGIRSTWYKGPINEIDLFRMLPFNNTWVRFEMTGEEILKTIQTFDYYNIAPSSGMLQMFKITNERNILKNILIFDGFEEKPLELHKTYKICTNDFLANGGSRMEYVRKWYKELRNKKDFGIIRELVKKFLLKMKGHIRKDKFVDENYPRINTE